LGLFSKKPKKIEVPLPPNPMQTNSRHIDYLDINPQSLPKDIVSNKESPQQEQKIDNPFKLEPIEAPRIEEKFETKQEESKEIEEINNVEVPEEIPELDIPYEIEKIESEIKGPLHIQVDNYKNIVENMAKIKDELIEAEGILLRLEEIKTQKDFISNSLKDSFEDVERKLTYLDNKIFGGV